jgi:hypothetical protein
MTSRYQKLAFAAAIGLAAAAGTANAQADQAIEQARAQGIVGEQADGYLGIAKAGSADIKSRVDATNIKRRAVYTDLAAKRGATVQEVAAATACELLQSRVPAGGVWRDEAGAWRSAPVQKPSFCP